MRKYLAADDRFTRVRLFDTLELPVNTVSDGLSTKARLKRALVALALAAALFAVGILADGFQGGSAVEPVSGPTATGTRAP
ncbi:MAG: hypothetical protein WD250_04940 [Egibacteraceae bacterium]